jgi:diaminopimelate epimerase
MSSIPFVKAEGLGNDFLVVDLRPGQPAAGIPSAADPAVVRALCDRHFGVGGDGVLAILPPVQGDARMRVINADGSEAEMCGNGIRCVAKLLYERDPSLRRPVLRIDTGAGLLECRIDARDGRAETVAVEMGRPQLDPPQIPVAAPGGKRLVRSPLRAGDRQFAFTAVSMGNPHAVIFVDDPAADLRALAEAYGRGIERDSLFPRRTNVEFARVRQGSAGIEINLVVWERGCGITLACGTGACATAVAACLEGRAAPDQEIPVHLPGGTLFIRVASQPAGGGSANYTGVSMRGPARIVFEAEIDPDQIYKPAAES